MGSMDSLQIPKGHLANAPDMEIGLPGDVLFQPVLNYDLGLLNHGEIDLSVNQCLASFAQVILSPNHYRLI